MKLPFRCAPILLAVVLSACVFTLAQSAKFPPYKGHVNDFANVINDATKKQMETRLLNFEQSTGAQIAVVTVQSLAGQPIEEYANELYKAWKPGMKTGANRDKGALLIVSVGDRKTRLETGYGLEGDIPDGLAGELIRRMRPDFQRNDFSQGLSTGIMTILATLAKKWNVSLDGIDLQYAWQNSPQQSVEIKPVFLIVFFLLAIVFFLMLARAFRRGGGGRGGGGWTGGPMIFNGGGGGFGGGDWGHSSSGGGGGSWGGFGGGDSGGGGASDSW